MTAAEQLHLFDRLQRLRDAGWDIRPDANRFRVSYPPRVRSRFGLIETANLFVSSERLEAAVCAAEAAEDALELAMLATQHQA